MLFSLRQRHIFSFKYINDEKEEDCVHIDTSKIPIIKEGDNVEILNGNDILNVTVNSPIYVYTDNVNLPEIYFFIKGDDKFIERSVVLWKYPRNHNEDGTFYHWYLKDPINAIKENKMISELLSVVSEDSIPDVVTEPEPENNAFVIFCCSMSFDGKKFKKSGYELILDIKLFLEQSKNLPIEMFEIGTNNFMSGLGLFFKNEKSYILMIISQNSSTPNIYYMTHVQKNQLINILTS